MKPFTPIVETYKSNKTDGINLSTSLDRQTLYLETSDESTIIFLSRPAAEWLVKQLKEALEKPKDSTRKENKQ